MYIAKDMSRVLLRRLGDKIRSYVNLPIRGFCPAPQKGKIET